jgi:hypothetical protein
VKKSTVRIASAVYLTALLLSFFTLSIPPALLPVYFGLGCIAIIPLTFGSTSYRIFGAVAFAVAVALAVLEYKAGVKRQEWMRQLKHKIAETNSAPREGGGR